MDHYILLRKISHLGASPLVHIVYSWFVKVHVPSINRIQYVRVSTVTSSMLPLTHGIPHRSTLSPLLFTIYTNDLPSIFFPLASLATSSSYIKEDLLKIGEWCCQKSQQDKNSLVKQSSTTSTVNDHNKALQVDLLSHRVRMENKLYCAIRIKSGA